MAVRPIPKGYHTATPYLIVRGTARALEFYKKAFDASEKLRYADPSGKLAHAEIKIGDSPILLGEEAPEMGYRAPPSLGGSPVGIMLYLKDVDASFRRAIEAGAKEVQPVKDQFYGDRSGTLTDPFGHVWTLATHKEDVSPDEMRRRQEAAMKQKWRMEGSPPEAKER
ncbi:MAG TPA: VOC family protein [Planctomycetota bacterium]|nr:VOC family protein [Planctomycetota bacterium]